MTDDIITLRNYLRVGAQNALCRWQLCEMTGWTDRHLRKVIEAARCEEDGEEYCIMNFGKGYYFVKRPGRSRGAPQDRDGADSIHCRADIRPVGDDTESGEVVIYMVYKCEACHAIFFEPYTYQVRENLDGENGIETRTVAECPFCGEEWFEEMEETEDGNEDTD